MRCIALTIVLLQALKQYHPNWKPVETVILFFLLCLDIVLFIAGA